MKIITPSIFKSLYRSPANSHKRDNGSLLIIAGSKQYHGALLYAVQAASRIVDLIHVLTTKENQNLIKKLKGQTAEFIPQFKFDIKNIDAVLVGPGLGVSKNTYDLTKRVLQSGKKAVLDASSLKIFDAKLKKLLNRNYVLTPHTREFKTAFGLAPLPQNVLRCAKKYQCTIVLKGRTDIIANPDFGMSLNKTGNQGMTKGGTGDVLAGVLAAFLCKNNPWISACAATYCLGETGDDLYKKQKTFYNSQDLIEQLPKTLSKLA
jgi:hydroxyethylthiazole kinase-like uncharacterized protein yjeF